MTLHATDMNLDEALDMVREWMVKSALRAEQGHCGRAAVRLGVHRNTMTRMARQYGIKTDYWAGRRRDAGKGMVN